MSQLEQYYNENINLDGERPFSELSPEEKQMIEGMWGFAFFKANEALKAAKKEVTDRLSLN
jgi:hypothetical protein